MEDEFDPEEDVEAGLTPEQHGLVGAEDVADMIARQSLGDTGPVADDDPAPPDD